MTEDEVRMPNTPTRMRGRIFDTYDVRSCEMSKKCGPNQVKIKCVRVIPAEAGIQGLRRRVWIPAFAGMTGNDMRVTIETTSSHSFER